MASPYGDLDRPPLHADALTRALVVPGALWTSVEVVAASASTNAALVDRAREGAASGAVLIAEHQTAGRGRLDRTWTAPARSGLTLSVLLRPYDVPLSRWPWLSLAAGLSVAAVVREQTGVEARVKWPNDVVVAERKLAGLLVERVEASGDSDAAAAVVGIGLNVSLTSAELPVPEATSLGLEGARTTDRTVLAKALLRALAGVVGAWERSGGASAGLRDSYVEACATLGRDVRVHLPGDATETGHAVGIDDFGRLLVDTGAEVRAFGAGDVVHVRAAT